MNIDSFYWGPIIWTFLHCLVFHIDETMFKKYKCEIIDIINLIGTNLPCNICSNHYKDINYIHYEYIFSVDCLILHLWNSHNNVSLLIDEYIYEYSILDKYKTLNIIDVKNNFFYLLDLIDSPIINELKEKLKIFNFE